MSLVHLICLFRLSHSQSVKIFYQARLYLKFISLAPHHLNNLNLMEYALARCGSQDKNHPSSIFQNHYLMKLHEPTQYELNSNHPRHHSLSLYVHSLTLQP